MTQNFAALETAEWEVKPNPVLKNELMIVRKDTQEIIASVHLANFENDDEAYACAVLMANAPQMRRVLLKINA